MTDTINRQPEAAIENTTEHVFKEWDEEKGAFSNIHVLSRGSADVLAVWTS